MVLVEMSNHEHINFFNSAAFQESKDFLSVIFLAAVDDHGLILTHKDYGIRFADFEEACFEGGLCVLAVIIVIYRDLPTNYLRTFVGAASN